MTIGASVCPKNWKKIGPQSSIACASLAGLIGDAP